MSWDPGARLSLVLSFLITRAVDLMERRGSGSRAACVGIHTPAPGGVPHSSCSAQPTNLCQGSSATQWEGLFPDSALPVAFPAGHKPSLLGLIP